MARTFGKIFQMPLLARSLRLILPIIVIAACLYGALTAWRVGASRLLTRHGMNARLPVQTEKAIEETPDDPEAHSGRAFVLLNTGNLAAALPEYERAAGLRPMDYFLWLELGRARDMFEDEEGSIAALTQAVRLAPYYAQPRWQLGNVLFRTGRTEEAFSELRQAASSNSSLLPRLIDLAWGATEGNPSTVEQIIRPERDSWRIALAKYFVKRGRVSEALAQFRLANGIPEQDRQSLLNDLLAARHFPEAYEVWAMASGSVESGLDKIVDGGFEGDVSRNNAGFGWRLAGNTQGVRLSLDKANPHSGKQSLRVDFDGDSNPNQPVLSQVILVERGARYRLRLDVKMEEIVTGGLPLLVVSDAGTPNNHELAPPVTLKPNSAGWQEYSVDFSTAGTTDAITISLRRQNCSASPCPIFGRMWVDDLTLEKRSGN